ncbi:hypothetical protein K438DRAFT_1197287 [Mycena galopus ATCC 62051]|nr:hypothetical protein K438DRAFT_1197287 [Mycena galopus ATCC 62051]
MNGGVGIASTLLEFKANIEARHQELLEMISAQSDSFDTVSSIGRSSLNSSSGSFSLLPACPKIFHGRESELEFVVDTLLVPPARMAILGPGGMGKTTLAMAALHHTNVVEKYTSRYFIPCDSAHTRDALVATFASYLGLESSRGVVRELVHHLSTGPLCLVVFDNLETTWEPVDERAKVEEFLSLLADVSNVTLLITMRGAERPAKVQWTRPFLRPLKPLGSNAAYETFIEIADEIDVKEDINELLQITDNIPLAIQLIATVASSVGCEATMERWKLERTALVSAGHDKRSNLEISIMLSLSSPRILSSPHAVELLGLMSLLSDGISDIDLLESKLPIPGVMECKATLLRTSLAYVDHAGKFKVLAPIREYIQKNQPPSPVLVRPLRGHFNHLLKLWRNIMEHSSLGAQLTTPHLVSNLGNLHNLLLHGLDSDHDLRDTIQGVILLNGLNLGMNRGITPLMLRLPTVLAQFNDHKLHGQFIIAAFQAYPFYPISNPDQFMVTAVEGFRKIQDLEGEARLYDAVGVYYLESIGDLKKAHKFYCRGRASAPQCDSDLGQIEGLIGLATIARFQGNWSEALQLARRTERIAVAGGNLWGELSAIRTQALCCLGLGDLTYSMELVNRAKELVVCLGMQGGQLECAIMNLEAEVYQLQTEYAKARHIHEAILGRTSPVLSPGEYAYALTNIALVDLVTGSSAALVSHNLNLAKISFQKMQYQRGVAWCEILCADLQLREDNTVEAYIEHLRPFASRWSGNTDDELTRYCLGRLADTRCPAQADAAASAHWVVTFLAFALRPVARNLLLVYQALRCLGEVLAHQGMDEEALSLLAVALDGFTLMGVHQYRAECMRAIGDIHVQHERFSEASALWKHARPLFERSLQAKAAAEIDRRLAELEVNCRN